MLLDAPKMNQPETEQLYSDFILIY